MLEKTGAAKMKKHRHLVWKIPEGWVCDYPKENEEDERIYILERGGEILW